MKQTAHMFFMVLMMLVALDLAVAGVLSVADRLGGKGAALVRYFEYGRSVPGKLDRWIEKPQLRDNLFDVAWVPDTIETSRAAFATQDADAGPIIRGYGMSFMAQILAAAAEQDPNLQIDVHGGPAAPPNLSFELFMQDRTNRSPGDVVVLGVLSSSVPAMAAMSNRTWAFEQPAPFTYPIFLPVGAEGLSRADPLVRTAAQERALQNDPVAAAAWRAQLAAQDRLHTNAAFAAPFMDVSPFARLVRRSLATKSIAEREAALTLGQSEFPYPEVLQRMLARFAQMAREDEQIPIVFLIQSRDPSNFDLQTLLGDVIDRLDIPVLATVDHISPRQPSAFAGDGHYTYASNVIFAESLRKQLHALGVTH